MAPAQTEYAPVGQTSQNRRRRKQRICCSHDVTLKSIAFLLIACVFYYGKTLIGSDSKFTSDQHPSVTYANDYHYTHFFQKTFNEYNDGTMTADNIKIRSHSMQPLYVEIDSIITYTKGNVSATLKSSPNIPVRAFPAQSPKVHSSLFYYEPRYIGHIYEQGMYNILTLSVSPAVFLVEDILSTSEIEHFIEIGAPNVSPSLMTGNAQMTGRKSSTYWIPSNDTISMRVTRRLLALLKNEDALTESLQFVEYSPGDKFDPHCDLVSYSNPRAITFGIYLQAAEKGGETVFPIAAEGRGIKVKPKPGSAVFFYTLQKDGSVDYKSLHAGAPVQSGKKYFMNLWVHDSRMSYEAKI